MKASEGIDGRIVSLVEPLSPSLDRRKASSENLSNLSVRYPVSHSFLQNLQFAGGPLGVVRAVSSAIQCDNPSLFRFDFSACSPTDSRICAQAAARFRPSGLELLRIYDFGDSTVALAQPVSVPVSNASVRLHGKKTEVLTGQILHCVHRVNLPQWDRVREGQS